MGPKLPSGQRHIWPPRRRGLGEREAAPAHLPPPKMPPPKMPRVRCDDTIGP